MLLRAPRTPLALVAAAVSALLLSGCGTSNNDDIAADTTPSGTCSYPPGGGSAGKKVTVPPTKPSVSGAVKATMKTGIGDIGLNLDAGSAPCTVNSFVSLAKQGYFDATSCHRLTTAGILVLQCGDPSGTGSGGPGYSFADELSGADALPTDEQASQQAGQTVKTYRAGTIAMANAGPDTNGGQFFLVYGDSPLPPAYAVFGTMDAAGLKAVTGAAKAGTETGESDGRPKTPVDITSVAVG